MTAQAGDHTPTVVREERRLGREVGVGQVVVAPGAEVAAGDRRVAAARAWLAVARALDAAEARDEAYAAASSGLEELGDVYLDPAVDDDTTVKLLAAEDAHQAGAEHAASALARVLENRIAMFMDSQRGRVTTPADE